MKPATSPSSPDSPAWIGRGSTAILPPPEYWAHLAQVVSGPQLDQLEEQSKQRLTEFTPSDLHGPLATALDLLKRFASDGWVEPEQRHRCPHCAKDLDGEEIRVLVCPYCGESYSEHGGITAETVFVRHLAPNRSVDWVVAIHGMNTSGAWQEAFSWLFSTTWGRSVPVAVYKYGIVIAGVVMAWRRGRLQRELRSKLAALRDQARARGFEGSPDVIAHSFGTWLFGHLLEDELARESDRLQFGRIILAGCVLRPDFDWKSVRDAGLVQDVLNHYGTSDQIVPLAHATIWDSGPSGRRGFDGDQVVNIRAEGLGHSDLFSIDKYTADSVTYLANSYQKYWRPFLTLPREEFLDLPDRMNPGTPWRQLPWALRGTMFPFFVLPLVVAIVTLFVACLGSYLWELRGLIAIIAMVSFLGVTLLVGSIAVVALWRRLRT